MGASDWAKRICAGDFLVLDTETTGLSGHDEIVEIAIVDRHGVALLDTLVRPCTAVISREALAIHGITPERVKAAPTMAFVAETIKGLIYGRSVIAYNADFDYRLLHQSLAAHNIWPGGIINKTQFVDLMHPYARYWGKRGRRGYLNQSLEIACRQQGIETGFPAHSALGDCLRALALLKVMAGERVNGKQD